MNKRVSFGFSIIFFLLGIYFVIANPTSSAFITFGMLLIAVAVITTLLPIFFPRRAKVELRIVGTRTIPVSEIKKRVKRTRKPKIRKRKTKKRTRKRRK